MSSLLKAFLLALVLGLSFAVGCGGTPEDDNGDWTEQVDQSDAEQIDEGLTREPASCRPGLYGGRCFSWSRSLRCPRNYAKSCGGPLNKCQCCPCG